jgi:hypothetical protein
VEFLLQILGDHLHESFPLFRVWNTAGGINCDSSQKGPVLIERGQYHRGGGPVRIRTVVWNLGHWLLEPGTLLRSLIFRDATTRGESHASRTVVGTSRLVRHWRRHLHAREVVRREQSGWGPH